MRIDLTRKQAIVTGSMVGIGFAIANGLAVSGATVVLNGRSEKSVAAAKARLTQTLPKAKVDAVVADLGTACTARPPASSGRFTPIILVNNLRHIFDAAGVCP